MYFKVGIMIFILLILWKCGKEIFEGGVCYVLSVLIG